MKSPPGLYRSAQPTPRQLARFAREGGRSVVYLRGGREHGAWQLEKEACDKLGLRLEEFVVRSRGAPEREIVLAAPAFFAALEKPALIHCSPGPIAPASSRPCTRLWRRGLRQMRH